MIPLIYKILDDIQEESFDEIKINESELSDTEEVL